ncbi:LUL3, partial [Symbiodinium microadriaticum]
MPTRLKRKQFSCLHRLRPEISVILNDVTQPPEVLDSFHKVLGRRECVLWTTGIEMVIAAVSFVGFDIRRSPLVLIVSSVLLLLAAIGFHGALVVSQLHIFMHMLLATSIPAAVCINFAVEDFAGVFDGKSQTPSWLLLLLLTLPYVVFLCLALVSFMLGIAVAELKQKIAEENSSDFSSDDLEVMAERAAGQDICCICVAVPKDTALVPCGHKAMCWSCAEQVRLRGLGCPVCRAPISAAMRVFDS